MVLELFTIIALSVIGIFVLLKGANYLVEGSADFARWLRVSPILVGLTIVAFGTSLPELMVSLFASLSGSPDLSLGNIIGSNIFNIGLVIGLSTLLLCIKVRSRTLIYEFPFLIVSTFMLLILSSDNFIFGKDTFTLGRTDGFILLSIFGFFLYNIYLSMRDDQKKVKKEFQKTLMHRNPLWKNILLIAGGLLALVVGGKLFTASAIKLALVGGVSEAFLGVTLAALGTSLPELVTSVVAAWKGQGDLAIGNIVGSNIFNILLILGFISFIKPIKVNPAILSIDGMVLIFITLLFLIFATRQRQIFRKEGVILIVVYLAYLSFVVWRL